MDIFLLVGSVLTQYVRRINEVKALRIKKVCRWEGIGQPGRMDFDQISESVMTKHNQGILLL